MKTIFYCGWLLLVVAGCSDAGASGEPVVTEKTEMKCAVKLSKPVYYVGESCQAPDQIMQGIQAVTHNGQTVRGVRCVKLEHVCEL